MLFEARGLRMYPPISPPLRNYLGYESHGDGGDGGGHHSTSPQWLARLIVLSTTPCCRQHHCAKAWPQSSYATPLSRHSRIPTVSTFRSGDSIDCICTVFACLSWWLLMVIISSKSVSGNNNPGTQQVLSRLNPPSRSCP